MTMQSCSGAWVWIIIMLVVVSCADLFLHVLFTPVQQFHPTCSRTFYTCSTLYLFTFLGKFFMTSTSFTPFYCPLD